MHSCNYLHLIGWPYKTCSASHLLVYITGRHIAGDLIRGVSEEFMRIDHNALGKKFLTFGLIFLAAGIVTQGFRFNFESAMFNLGLIFMLSGLAALGIERLTGGATSD